MGKKRGKKITIRIKLDPFKIPRGKDPTRQRPGAGAHRVRKKEKPTKWHRRNPETEDE